MMKIIAITIFLILPIDLMAESSLLSDAISDVITITDSTSIQNKTAFTWLMWVKPTGTGARMVWKSTNNADFHRLQSASANVGRATTDAATGAITCTAGTANGVWDFYGMTYDESNGITIYGGDATNLAATCSQAAHVTGVGSTDTDNGNNLLVANRNTLGDSKQGNWGFFGMWNRVLTLAEIQEQQYTPHVTPGNVVFNLYGYVGAGTQPDYSGNGNVVTPTSMAVSSDGPPIFFPRGAM